MSLFNAAQSFTVCVRRNKLYDDPVLQDQANREVLADAQLYTTYDEGGIAEFVPILRKFPSLKDSPKEFYCTELLGHYCLEHSDNKLSLGKTGDDDVSPYAIQTNPALLPVRAEYSYLRVMDYVITTALDMTGFFIALRTAGIKAFSHRRDIGTHGGCIVSTGGELWLAEMLRDGGPVLAGLGKYGIHR